MSVFRDARDELAAKLTAAGSPATVDPAALPPFVLVDLITINTNTPGIGTWSGTVPVKIVAAPPGDLAAATFLEDQLELVLRTLGRAPATPGLYLAGGKELPSYTVTYPVHVPNPDC